MKKTMNKRILSCILTLAMVMSLVPVNTKQAFASTGITVDVIKGMKHIFANCNAIILKEGTTTNYTNLYIANVDGSIDSGADPIDLNGVDYFNDVLTGNTTTGFDLSNIRIFGGGNGKKIEGNTNITMVSGKVETIYGGGYGQTNDATVSNTNIKIEGGDIPYVYGGGYGQYGAVEHNTNIKLTGATISAVYGAGYDANVGETSNIEVAGATVYNIYGGGSGSTQVYSVNATNIIVNSGNITNIFGGGLGTNSVLSRTNIEINGGIFSFSGVNQGDIYGGGYYSSVGSNESKAECNITIRGGEFSRRKIIGGGLRGNIYGDTHITVHDGATWNDVSIVGGGKDGSTVFGDTSIVINGGSFASVVLGGYTENLVSNADATVSGGTIKNIYKGAVSGSALLTYTGGTITGTVDAELCKPVAFEGLSANGASGTSPTTELTLTFSEDPISLTASHITVTGATKGTLSGTGTTRTLNLSNITVGNGKNVTVTVSAPPAFTITPPTSKTVAVYKYVPTLTDITITPTVVNYNDRATAGTKVADLAATGTPATGITYALDGSGTHDSLFQIVGSELQIMSGTMLAAQSYTVKVKVCEDAQPLNTFTKSISFVPTIIDITRQYPSAEITNATSVTYRVTFSERVSGVDTGDFTLTTTGNATGSIAWVSFAGGNSIDVAVNTVAGEGTLRLDLKASGTGITDAAGTAISGGFTGGQTYTIDRIAPTVTSITRQTPSAASTNAGSLTYRVTFSEGVSGVSIDAFALTTTGNATGSIASVSSTSGNAIDVTVNTVAGEGTLRLDLKASGTYITDAAGNAISGGFTGGETYTVDRIAPTLTAGQVTRTSDTNAAVKFTSNETGKYYYEVVESGAAMPSIDTSGAGVSCSTGENTITLTTLSAGAKDIYIVVKDALDNVSVGTFRISIPIYGAPPSNNDGSGGGSGSGSGGGSSNSGNIIIEQQQASGAPASSLNNDTEDLKKTVFNTNELSRIEAGETAKVILKVTNANDSVSEAEKKMIQEKLEAEQQNTAAPEILYVDISLYKKVGEGEEVKVTNTNGKIKISIEVPESIRSTETGVVRTYRVVRIHNGVAELLEGTYDPVTHLFTFETDRFSTYALTYQDSKVIPDATTDTTKDKVTVYKDFRHLQLTAKAAKTSQTLTFKKAANVDGYLIYGAKCGEEMKLLADLPADTTSYKVNQLKQGTNYKFQVKAYRMMDKEQVIIMTSKTIHTITESKTYGNPTKVTTKQSSVTLAVGKSKTVTGQVVLPKGKKLEEHTATIRYESSNQKIATVNSKGKITAKAKGTCYVYAYAQNGVYKRIKVTVQ